MMGRAKSKKMKFKITFSKEHENTILWVLELIMIIFVLSTLGTRRII